MAGHRASAVARLRLAPVRLIVAPVIEETPAPDLPPGLDAAQVERVRTAAGACRTAIERSNYPISADIPADLLTSVCKVYETGLAEWRADGLDQVLVARDALKQASDAARETENAEVLDAARMVITALNDLYVEVDTALRAIDREAIEQALALVASRQTAVISREDAGRVPEQIGEDVGKVEATLQQAQVTINNITKHTEYNLIKIVMGDLKILIDRVTATLAHIDISFRMEKLFDGIISISADSLEAVLAAMKQTAEAVRDAAGKAGDLAEAVTAMLKPLARVVKDGGRLVRRVRAAVERLFGPKEPLPWPTGLRLLP
ncbi:MAG: hypothetical protein ACU0B1_00370, partial [Thermohalobaculum sp.]